MMKKIMYMTLSAVALLGCADKDMSQADIFAPQLKSNEMIAADILWNGATVTGEVIFDGGAQITGCGVVYSKKSNFDPYEAFSETPTEVYRTDGDFTDGVVSTVLKDLEPDTEYFCRIYAVNDEKLGFGDQISFKTPKETHEPYVTTVSIDKDRYTHFSADLKGSVDQLWGLELTACGFLVSTTALTDPALDQGTVVDVDPLPTQEGEFEATITTLDAEQKYYVYAFAGNSLGISFGNVVEFTTKAVPQQPGMSVTPPVYGSADATNVEATVKGTVATSGASAVSEYGIMYSTDQNADLSTWTKVVVGSTIDIGTEFSTQLTSLTSNTTYYVISYAENADGIGYSAQSSFRTAISDRYDDTFYYFELPAFEANSRSYVFLDRNLGATQVAQDADDSNAYGWYFQWGRMADGHQIFSNDPADKIAVTVDVDGIINNPAADIAGKFVTTSMSPYDWRPGAEHKSGGQAKSLGELDNLWSADAEGGVNNPCPDGYRVPTNLEWGALLDAANQLEGEKTVASVYKHFKVPSAGRRAGSGAMNPSSGTPFYWCSNMAASTWRPYYVTTSSNIYSSSGQGFAGHGYSVRCIKR